MYSQILYSFENLYWHYYDFIPMQSAPWILDFLVLQIFPSFLLKNANLFKVVGDKYDLVLADGRSDTEKNPMWALKQAGSVCWNIKQTFCPEKEIKNFTVQSHCCQGTSVPPRNMYIQRKRMDVNINACLPIKIHNE